MLVVVAFMLIFAAMELVSGLYPLWVSRSRPVKGGE